MSFGLIGGLVAAADIHARSTKKRAYSMVTVTPVMAGPVMFNLYGGQDGKPVLRSAPTGSVQTEVQGLQAAAAKP